MSFKISSKEDYQKKYKECSKNSDKFWSEIAENFHWFKKWNKVSDCSFFNEKPRISWFEGGRTNISYNCLDRNIFEKKLGDKIAFIEEANEIGLEPQKITYLQLYEKVCAFANLLKAQNVAAQDRVCIYMPSGIEAAIAMLACARIGAVHSVVFAGFSAKALASRIQDCGARILITADLLFRGDKKIELFKIATQALATCDEVESVILYCKDNSAIKKYISEKISIKIWQEEIIKYNSNCEIYEADAEDKLFILYTSGSTGKPKGVIHSHGGYMIYCAYSFQNVFDYQDGDIFFSTADIGWITGHSYLVYGPLLCGATSLIFAGVPTYPDASRFWKIIEKYKVNIFYTAPTAIRALMQKGDEFVEGHNLSSLKVLGSVGEPINNEAWQWYFEKVGNKKCDIIDSWWQTETGGIMISSLAGAVSSKPTFAGFPLIGIDVVLLDDNGVEIKEANKVGNLCIKKPWPSMLRGVWGDDKKFYETYFKRFKNYYFAGDGALRDENGLYRIIGRVDDVINVSGHRLGTAEIENVINMSENVAESAVIGYAHEIKGEGICVFVIAKNNIKLSDKDLERQIIENIKTEIGSIAKPDRIYILSDLPKTRSGKIMRRVLKKIIAGEEDFGDISTLLNPEIVNEIRLKL